MTLTLFFLFVFGFFCGWMLLKAANWLPLLLSALLLCGSPAYAFVTVNVNMGAGCSFPQTLNIFDCCGGGIYHQFTITANGQHVSAGPGYVAGGEDAYIQGGSGSADHESWPADGGTVTFNICNYSSITTYYFNYCITNDSGLPMTARWISSCTNIGPQNLGLGQSWCINFSTTNVGCVGGFSMFETGPDGTTTNISLWPPTGPNGTNSAPGTPGGGNNWGPGNPGPGGNNGTGPGGTGVGPGAGVPGSNTNLTGNQYYQGVTNLQDTLQFSFGYLGNVIAAGNLVTSNELELIFNDAGTNEAKLTTETNLMAQVTNALAMLNTNTAGLSTNQSGGFSNAMWQALYNFGTNYAFGGVTNSYYSNGDYIGYSMGSNWGNPYGSIASGATNVASGSNGSLWFIAMKTNPLAAYDPAHPSNDPNSGIDLDPRHNSWFIGISPFMRNIEVWLITLFVLWQIRAWMSERLLGALRTPSQGVTLDAASVTQAVVKTATTAALLVGLPAAMAAVAYNFANWFGYTSALDPLGSAIQTVCGGTVGPLIADGIGIVGYMFPISFAGGAILYLGAVWVALDVLTAAVMFKLRSPL